ncbi:hypothetical protein [Microlunatus flavus]|uniref:Uncharacterized protein n=1 Tax=Microlunatus flavus TaxID=1036181 RepID=A0A1H9N0A4_9ACTN|nr:hypothetical protein [Microlunatus flavus]SER29372.1 hypothetical protein SAMN05421756_11228 [Microlunatus flavus]
MSAPDTAAETDGVDVRPISRWGLAWRVLAAVALVGLLLNGSVRMHDDAWPFGPMSQYAFFPGPDDTVVITRVYGVLADGQRVELPLRVDTAGIRRADVEGRIPAIEQDPSLLRAVSEGWSARHPGEPRPVEVSLVQDRQHLHRGRVVATDQVELARWRVTP